MDVPVYCVLYAGGVQLEAVLEEMPKWALVQEVLQVPLPQLMLLVVRSPDSSVQSRPSSPGNRTGQIFCAAVHECLLSP